MIKLLPAMPLWGKAKCDALSQCGHFYSSRAHFRTRIGPFGFSASRNAGVVMASNREPCAQFPVLRAPQRQRRARYRAARAQQPQQRQRAAETGRDT